PHLLVTLRISLPVIAGPATRLRCWFRADIGQRCTRLWLTPVIPRLTDWPSLTRRLPLHPSSFRRANRLWSWRKWLRPRWGWRRLDPGNRPRWRKRRRREGRRVYRLYRTGLWPLRKHHGIANTTSDRQADGDIRCTLAIQDPPTPELGFKGAWMFEFGERRP